MQRTSWSEQGPHLNEAGYQQVTLPPGADFLTDKGMAQAHCRMANSVPADETACATFPCCPPMSKQSQSLLLTAFSEYTS